MRFDQLHVIKEDASSDARARQSGAATIQMSMADLYDMLNQPYPLNERGAVPNGFWEPQTFAVGNEEGMLSPGIARAYNQWVQGGRMPGQLIDKETGELIPYNNNPFLLDLSYGVAQGLFQFAGDVTRGVAYAGDELAQFLGVTDSYHMTRAAAAPEREADGTYSGATWMDDFSKWFENQTDLDYRDRQQLMQAAISQPGDILSLVTGGNVWNDINFQGFAAMLATELPSEMIDMALMASGIGAVAAGVGLNAAEAGGAAAQEVMTRINQFYDNGELQVTPQWKVAQEFAAESLRQDGYVEGTEEWNDRLDTLAIQIIQDSTLQSNMIRATAATGAVLDSAADLLIYRRLGGGVIRNATARLIAGPTIEGSDEALQQVLTNVGLSTSTGVPVDAWEGAINSFYQGAVIGAAMGGFTGAVDAGRNLNDRRVAAQAKLRQFFFGDDYNNIETIVQVMGMDPSLLVNRIRNPETGQLDLTSLLDTTIPRMDQLSERQRLSMARTGTVNINGTRYTRGQIQRATRNYGLMSMLENASYDPDANRWNVTYQTEEDLREVVRLFGIDVEGDTNAALREIESILNIDMRVEGRSDLEPPTWEDLNARQREEFINTGAVTIFDDPRRQGQRWTREDVLDASYAYEREHGGPSVPREIVNLAMPTSARPTLQNSDAAGEYNDIELQIESNPNIARAEQILADDQAAWDEEFGADYNPDGTPKSGEGPNAEVPRPDRDQPDYSREFAAAESTVGTLRARQRQIEAQVANDAALWDAEHRATHNPDGTPRLLTQREEELMSTPVAQNQASRDATDAAATRDAEPEPTTDAEPTDAEPTDAEPAPEVQTAAPNAPRIGSDLARAHVVYNATLRLADGQMDPIAVGAMFDGLEQTYPGITQEVFGEGGLESYRQNPVAVEQEVAANVRENPPVRPEPAGPDRPPRGTEVDLDGQTYRFLGQMWAPVKPDGSLGSTGHQNHQALMTQWQDSLPPDVPRQDLQPTPVPDAAPEVDDTAPAEPETQTTAPELEVPAEPVTPPVRRPAPDPTIDLRDPANLPQPGTADAAPEVDTTTPPPVTGTGRGDGRAEVDQRRRDRDAAADDHAMAQDVVPPAPEVDDTAPAEPTAPETSTSDVSTSDTTDTTPTRTAPEPVSTPSRDEQPAADTTTAEPEVDDTAPVQPVAPDSDTTDVSTSTTTDTPPTRTAPEPVTTPTRDEVPTAADRETDTAQDQEPEQDQQQEPEPTQDAPINIVTPTTVPPVAATVATTQDPNANTGARTDTTQDTSRRSPRIRPDIPASRRKLDFGKLKPVQVRDPEDLNKFRRVT